MRLLKRVSASAIVALCLAAWPATTSCGKHIPSTITTPQGKQAYTADQILIRVGELQDTVIAANGSGAISTPTARIIVKFTVDAAVLLKTVPSGWQATLSAAWQTAKGEIPADQLSKPAITASISAVDIVLAALGGK